MSTIRDYQVDHLLLLVGSNPLPCAVAGRLLVTATGGAITLIHSRDSHAIAEKLRLWLPQDGHPDIRCVEVKEADAASVYDSVSDVLEAYEKLEKAANRTGSIRVGLNYTAGTKVMSVQAYRALENWARYHHRDGICSYLDARSLRMCFDPAPGRAAISFHVGQEVNIDIHELLELHNWKLIGEPIAEPILPLSAQTLLAVHMNPTETELWKQWLYNELFKAARRPKVLEQPYIVCDASTDKELQQQPRVKQFGFDAKWKARDLQNIAIPWPTDLPEVDNILCAELKQEDSKHLTLRNAGGWNNPEGFCRWLSGMWLESAVLDVLRNCPELQPKQCYMNLKVRASNSSTSEELFEFDVVAMRGYQLFAFSCTTDDKKGLLKLKLFEAYVRAQQMGGDEACVVLVCCASAKDVGKLKMEMHDSFGPRSRVQVFGIEHLVHLSAHIEDWVREQSKEH